MKYYSYRIMGTSIIEDTNITTLRELKIHILDFFGKCKIEYWGKRSGEIYINQPFWRL